MSVDFANRDYEAALEPWTPLLTTTVTHETGAPLLGAGSAKVVTPGSATFEGLILPGTMVLVSASTQYTLSVYVKATATGGALRPLLQERTGAAVFITNVTFANITPADALINRYSWTWTTGATAGMLYDLRMFTVVAAQARTFYVDGWQLDLGASATTYDGADAPVTGGANLTVGRGAGVSQPTVQGVRSVS